MPSTTRFGPRHLGQREAQVRFDTRQINGLVSGLEEHALELPLLEPQCLLERSIGSSLEWREVIETANDAAEYDGIAILLLGETGYRKEVMAEAIHAQSPVFFRVPFRAPFRVSCT